MYTPVNLQILCTNKILHKVTATDHQQESATETLTTDVNFDGCIILIMHAYEKDSEPNL
jgi:hypothetical protein